MILIGSLAAKMRNELPIYREGKVQDIDLRGTIEEYDSLHEYVAINFFPNGIQSWRNPNRKFILYLNKYIEFDTTTLVSNALIENLEDTISVPLMHLTVKLPSITTLWCIKKSLDRYDINRSKHQQDMDFWYPRINITSAHQNLLNQLIIEADMLYENDPTIVKLGE